MAGDRALRDRTWRRLRVSGAAIQIALRHRPRDHRRTLERLGVLRTEEPAGRGMTRRPQSNGVGNRAAAKAGRPTLNHTERPAVRKVRCAVYTRKSTEERPAMEFNSLDAQPEAC